ncbi:hypothetical protein [Paenibacillus sp. P36]|uniref:hypothetical protein n=1 Tax=Paenibacillus sp. P36 TaxID=3342538 RepID=UPI0038B2F461
MNNGSWFVIYYGMALIILAFYRLLDLSVLNEKFLLAVTFSGFFFILYDLFDFIFDKNVDSNKWLRRFWSFISANTLNFAAISLVVIPFLPFSDDSSVKIKISEFLGVCGIGIVILLIGLKAKEKMNLVLKISTDALCSNEKSLEKIIIEIDRIRNELNIITTEAKSDIENVNTLLTNVENIIEKIERDEDTENK